MEDGERFREDLSEEQRDFVRGVAERVRNLPEVQESRARSAEQQRLEKSPNTERDVIAERRAELQRRMAEEQAPDEM